MFKAPCLLVCRNNGWAISVPRSIQTASATFAQKAIAYGMPGVLVDGNDILAMIHVVREAAARARAGEGPTMIECLTYRRQGHSSSDDPSVYRDPNEPKQWESNDPIERFRRYLTKKKLWTEAWERELTAEIEAEIIATHDAVKDLPGPAVETIFDDVFEKPTWILEEEKAWLMSQARTKSFHAH